jgi:L-lactate dehydrogenase complex protein LldF
VGGHVYGTTYGGPIGSVITPHLRGLKEWKHLSDASSLCGACTETCPVKIDLHRHLLQNRQMGAQAKPDLFQKAAFKIFALLANRASFWAWTTRLARFGRILQGPVKGTRLDPAAAWTKTRELPPIARQTFREWWSQRK